MAKMLEPALVQKKFAEVPLQSYESGQTVIEAGSSTGRLFVLKQGAVEVVKDGVQIGKVAEPGAIFGELSALLGQPHTADVRAVEPSTFHVADAATVLKDDPTVALYVATILAQRLDLANQALIEVRQQLAEGKPRSAIGKALDKLAQSLRYSNDPAFAAYPYALWI
jgi:CRP-like cAMP-binding protein